MTNIRDIAAEAGVSVATASRALTGKGRVSAATVERVRAIAQRHRFQPNEIARSLSSGRSHSLGLLVPDITNPFFPELMAGAESAAKARGQTILLTAALGADSAREDLSVLRARGVDGFIVVGNPFDSAEQLREAAGSRPLVVVDRSESVTDLSTVVTDHVEGAALAVRHLIELGHTRIAHISGPPGLDVTDLRVAGYERELRAAGLEPRVVDGDFTVESGAAAVRALLDGPAAPSAITTANDLAAIGAMNAVLARGGSVPGDLSIVGYDDIVLAALVHPGLTTVAQDIGELGARAVEELERQLTGDTDVRTVSLSTSLVERGTTGRAS
ncbi:LacI family DNA-binding transcriptional regulator [Prauserella cavernicola]|uniref:LacI family DNA-binding transcriptional regulator n=1 Tax=Prauserella cavernicola TaxID=2800127 RepID=A0A934V3Z1_9PSEU|nr:LacI family DNA-binding transcriptional regulator [Prauserella cavernicola]MBK1783565.1 LacI family DNA-binding transcriptional regulator [Prauserella cavernicola]